MSIRPWNSLSKSTNKIFQVLDYGACRDGVPEQKRGRRILVDTEGCEIINSTESNHEADFLDDN